MNQGNPNQLFLGTYRLYRTDNAEAPAAGDVHWKPISGDLTTRLHRRGAQRRPRLRDQRDRRGRRRRRRLRRHRRRLGLGQPERADADNPTWTRSTARHDAARTGPVDAVRGRPLATGGSPTSPTAASTRPRRASRGHVFTTTDGGKHWTNITGNLPDVAGQLARARPVVPEHALRRHRRRPVRHQQRRRAAGRRSGTGFPKVAVWQLDYDPTQRHARGRHPRPRRLHARRRDADGAGARRLEGRRRQAGRPGQHLDYTITVQQHRQRRRDRRDHHRPGPGEHRRSCRPATAARSSGGKVTWTGLTVPAGGSRRRCTSPSRSIASLAPTVTRDRQRRHHRSRRPRASARRAARTRTPIAPPHARRARRRPTQTDGAQGRQTSTTPCTSRTTATRPTRYTLSATSGTWPATSYDATCTTPSRDHADASRRATRPTSASRSTCRPARPTTTTDTDDRHGDLGRRPGGQRDGARSRRSPSRVDTLLVDNDNNAPDRRRPYYKDALTAAGVAVRRLGPRRRPGPAADAT